MSVNIGDDHSMKLEQLSFFTNSTRLVESFSVPIFGLHELDRNSNPSKSIDVAATYYTCLSGCLPPERAPRPRTQNVWDRQHDFLSFLMEAMAPKFHPRDINSCCLIPKFQAFFSGLGSSDVRLCCYYYYSSRTSIRSNHAARKGLCMCRLVAHPTATTGEKDAGERGNCNLPPPQKPLGPGQARLE